MGRVLSKKNVLLNGSRPSLLIIDAGHSGIKFHLYSTSPPQRWSSPAKPFLFPKELLKLEWDETLMMGTNELRTQKLLSHFSEMNLSKPHLLEKDLRVPISVAKDLKGVGNDRLAQALGANELYPNSNVLVISAGSALVIDSVDASGQYQGGLIGLGLERYSQAMLGISPKLICGKSTSVEYPGTHTSDAVQLGWWLPALSCIRETAKKISAQKLILTGGGALALQKEFANAEVHPYLGADAMAKAMGYI